MKSLQEIENEITALTFKIEAHYPELYKFLDENPITISTKGAAEINIKIMLDYLDSLKQILKHHIETHKNK